MKSRYNEAVLQTTSGNAYRRVVDPPDKNGEGGADTEITIGFCCMDALLSTYVKEDDPSQADKPDGPEKMKRYELAKRIQKSMEEDEDFDLTMGDQQYLDGFLNRKWIPDVYSQCHIAIYKTTAVK